MKPFSWSSFLAKLRESNQLVHIYKPVSPVLEISEITDRMSKINGPALFFEQTLTQFPVITNLYGSEDRMLSILGLKSYEQYEKEIENIFSLSSTQSTSVFLKKLPWMLRLFRALKPVKLKKKGLWYRNKIEPVDLYKLPILQCWPYDGGRYITLPMVHTINPFTGLTNVGMYRMQVFDKQTTGMHWHLHKGGAYHYELYKKIGKKMPVVVTIGGDPIYAYVASAPLPENINEYMLAGFLRKKPVYLVKATSCDIYIPYDVDFVIEGYIDPDEPLRIEGPFGDHTGFYSLPEPYPVFHVTHIYHRDNAVYPATIVGVPPMEDAHMGIATQKLFLPLLRHTILQDVADMHLPVEGGFHNLAIVSIHQRYPGQAVKVMNAIWGAGQLMFTKNIIIVDDKINIRDWRQVLQALLLNSCSYDKLHSVSGPLDALDHAHTQPLRGKKLGIDATSTLQNSLKTISFPETLISLEMVSARLRILAQIGQFIAGICYVQSPDKQHIQDIFQFLCTQYQGFIAFVEKHCEHLNYADILWYVLANFNPETDLLYPDNSSNFILGFDGCMRSDDPSKKQPNVITMNEQTIERIDAIWETLNIGPFISSPSCKYKKIAPCEGYSCDENFYS